MIAQQQLRHKSKKQSFRNIYWLTVIINLSVLIFFLMPNGINKLQSLLPIDNVTQRALPELTTPDYFVNTSTALKKWFQSQSIDKDVQVYKWQDENGIWHFSDSAPENK